MNEWLCNTCGYSTRNATAFSHHERSCRQRMRTAFLEERYEKYLAKQALEQIRIQEAPPPKWDAIWATCPDCKPEQEQHLPDCERRPLTAAETAELERSLAAAAQFKKEAK